ncbi:MAG: hypothetical protein IJH36_02490 [Clostridia bacterium]|nr:hypothetical protein [Clostridia bacterium]MBQ9598653.1 hypothetical protein [Clostridia bacterium]
MKLNLDFALYKGKTRLRDWWKQVKAHFIEVQDAINELDTDISNEAATRDRVDTAIMQNLTDEISARAAADNAEAAERERVDNLLFDNIADAAAAIAAETSARQAADSELRGNLVDIAAALAAEKSAREAVDTALGERVTPLEAAAHTHDNKEILDAIDGERVQKWDSIESQVTQEQLNAVYDFFAEVAYAHDREMQNIYAAMGCTVYDGGLFGAPVDGAELDGGEFGDEESGIVDGGDFEPFRCSCGGGGTQTIDGGGYDNVSGSVIDGGSLDETGGTVYDGGVYP